MGPEVSKQGTRHVRPVVGVDEAEMDTETCLPKVLYLAIKLYCSKIGFWCPF